MHMFAQDGMVYDASKVILLYHYITIRICGL